MLNYTGHPLVDVGIATITAFADEDDPANLTEAHLDKIADYITREYVRQPLKSFLTVAFPNSGFTQPAFEKTPKKRLDYAQKVLRNYKAGTPTLSEPCVFTGQPAVAVAFGDKEDLPLGRAFRQHIPLLTGEDVINFHPYGEAGLPVSGEAMLAIQAFPLGCAKCGGRLLAVHSDNKEVLLHFARDFLNQNRTLIGLVQQTGEEKMPESSASYRTLLIETLLKALKEQVKALKQSQPFSITAYHLSNSGRGPKLDIYPVPMEVIGFLREMERAEYHLEWQALIKEAEVKPLEPKGKTKKTLTSFRRRNRLYENLFDLPQGAKKFWRSHFYRITLRIAKGEPTLREHNLQAIWKITERFLRRMMNMQPERLERIRQLGDRLADYIYQQDKAKFFNNFCRYKYFAFRTALLRASLGEAEQGKPPLFDFEMYVDIFEFAEEDSRPDWYLARDLVFMRMIDQLHKLKWSGFSREALPEIEEETDSSLATSIESSQED